MVALTFSVGSPCLREDKLHSDKAKQAFSKESNWDSLASYSLPRSTWLTATAMKSIESASFNQCPNVL